MKSIVRDSTGFDIDPAKAMELREAKGRLEWLSRRGDYEQETPGLNARVAAIEKTLQCPCPSLYGVKQINADRERLEKLSRARGSGQKMTREEDVEEAHLTARVAAWSMAPERDARRRLGDLEKRQQQFESGHKAELLSLEEQTQLRLLRTAYPGLDPDMRDREAAIFRAHKEIAWTVASREHARDREQAKPVKPAGTAVDHEYDSSSGTLAKEKIV